MQSLEERLQDLSMEEVAPLHRLLNTKLGCNTPHKELTMHQLEATKAKIEEYISKKQILESLKEKLGHNS